MREKGYGVTNLYYNTTYRREEVQTGIIEAPHSNGGTLEHQETMFAGMGILMT